MQPGIRRHGAVLYAVCLFAFRSGGFALALPTDGHEYADGNHQQRNRQIAQQRITLANDGAQAELRDEDTNDEIDEPCHQVAPFVIFENTLVGIKGPDA